MINNDDPSKRDRVAESMLADDIEIDVEVKTRIHIIPLGYERDRVIAPPLEMGAHTVVLVTHAHDQEEDDPEYYDDIYDAFDESAIEVVETECDIFNLYDAIGTIAGLIQNYQQEEVFVNLATGGKVTAIAGMIACMVTEAATPYYVTAEDYGEHQQTPVAETVTGISNLPTYPIDAPSPEQVQVLDHIEYNDLVSKQDLIKFGEDNGLPFIADYNGDNPKGKYRKLDSTILGPLQDDEAITVTEQGRKKMVQLTESGENTLHGFRYMVNSEIES